MDKIKKYLLTILFIPNFFLASFADLGGFARTCFLFKAHWAKRSVSRKDAKIRKARKGFGEFA